MRGKHVFLCLLIILCLALCEKPQKGAKKCKYGCNNFVKILADQNEVKGIEKFEVSVTQGYIESTIDTIIMSRYKYWCVTKVGFTSRPQVTGYKALHPNLGEAMLWYENGKCKIGRICPVDGDCWGSDADVCYSDYTSDWVEERTMSYKGRFWFSAYREACTLDWDCKYIKHTTPIHYNSEGEMFVVVDDSKILIHQGIKNFIVPFKNYHVFIPSVPIEKTKTLKFSCFKYKKDLLCDTVDNGFLMFEEGTKCTVLGDNKYCLNEGEFNRIREFGAEKFASIEDINQVRDAFIVNQEKDNYNLFVVNSKIIRIQQILLGMIEELSISSPNILNKILDVDAFARSLSKGVFELCPCEKEESCNVEDFHDPTMRHCPQDTTEMIYIFNVNKSLDYTIDEKFKFQGKDVHIQTIIDEENAKNSDFNHGEENSNDFWSSLNRFVNPFSGLSYLVSYIALGLSLFNFLRR